MSNAITTMTNVPAHIAARIAARQQSGGKSTIADAIVGDSFGGPRISIKSGRYRLVEGGVETVVGITLDTVVVGANPRISKVFYANAYDPNATDARPQCYSNDGIKPDSSVAQPVHSNCTSCPHNVLGSKILPSGAKSKMCADQRHLAVVPAQDPSKVYSLTVPVSGMKALREYFKDLTNYGIGPEEVVTELGFDANASFPKVTFRQKSFVPEKGLSRIDELLNSDEVKVATRQLAQTVPPALAAPGAIDDAYADEPAPATPAPAAPPPAAAAAAPKPSAPPKPTVVPVQASSELAKKLDNLFDE